jgi:hypothetical protein
MTLHEWVPQSVMVSLRLTDRDKFCVPRKVTYPVDLELLFQVRTTPWAFFLVTDAAIS